MGHRGSCGVSIPLLRVGVSRVTEFSQDQVVLGVCNGKCCQARFCRVWCVAVLSRTGSAGLERYMCSGDCRMLVMDASPMIDGHAMRGHRHMSLYMLGSCNCKNQLCPLFFGILFLLFFLQKKIKINKNRKHVFQHL